MYVTTIWHRLSHRIPFHLDKASLSLSRVHLVWNHNIETYICDRDGVVDAKECRMYIDNNEPTPIKCNGVEAERQTSNKRIKENIPFDYVVAVAATSISNIVWQTEWWCDETKNLFLNLRNVCGFVNSHESKMSKRLLLCNRCSDSLATGCSETVMSVAMHVHACVIQRWHFGCFLNRTHSHVHSIIMITHKD